MDGHFKKRGDRWYFWVELERGADGKRRQLSRGGFRTRKEAEKAFGEVRDQIRRGDLVTETKTTVAAFLNDDWLPAIRASIRPGTHDHYSNMVQGYVVPRIGARRLSEVTPGQLNALYAALLVDGRRQFGTNVPRGLSPKTVRHVHTLLHKAFSDAVRWGSLARNPADRAEAPRPRTPEMKVWDISQLRRFLDQVADDPLGPVWLLMATTGMRRGEVLGVRWSDVDLDGGRLSIVQTHVLVNRTVIISEPKTLKGKRSVALDPATVTALRQLRRRQLEDRLSQGELWTDTGLVAIHKDGTAINPRLFSSWFTQHARAAGLPPIRLHDYADSRVMPTFERSSPESLMITAKLSA